jgi:polar amino acid transport system substrate-binding protein
MKFVSKLAAGALALMLAVPAFAQQAAQSTWERIQKTKVLRVGAANTPPYYMIDPTGSAAPGGVESNGVVWRGLGPALAKKIADEMGVKLEIVETTWGGAVAGLQAGQFDFMIALDATLKRALSIDFVSAPLMWFPFVVLTKSGVDATHWSDLDKEGIVVGVENGSSYDQVASRFLKKATFKRFPDTTSSIAAFMAGQLDAYVWSGPQADFTQSKFPAGAKKFTPRPVVAIPSAAGIRKEPDQRWRNYLDAAFTSLYYSGEVTRAYNEFMAGQGVPPESVTPLVKELQ